MTAARQSLSAVRNVTLAIYFIRTTYAFYLAFTHTHTHNCINILISDIRDVRQVKQDTIAAITDINDWGQSCRREMNSQWSEVIWLGTYQQLPKLSQADMMLQIPDETLIA